MEVKKWIDRGVDLDVKDSHGQTPVQIATRFGKIWHLNECYPLFFKEKSLTWIFLGHAKIVNLLASNGADLNLTDCNGYTPIYTAVSSGIENILWLLKWSLIAQENRSDKSHFVGSFEIGRENVVDALLENHADPNMADNDGLTPLHISVITSESRTLIHF